MPRTATIDEIPLRERPQRREATLDEIQGGIGPAALMGQTWTREDINTGRVDISNYMHRAAARIQEYQQARQDLGEDRLTANEQVAIVDAYRQMAGLQPEGFYLTAEGAAVPKDRFAEIRRKRTEDDAWANFKSNLSNTVLQNLSGIRAAQAKITDSLGITEGALAEATRGSEEVSRILQPQGGKSGFAGQAVGNVMNLFLAAGQAPAMFAASTAGSTFIDVAQRRAEGQEISPYTEWTAAITNAAIEYALESFGQKVAQRAGLRLGGFIGDIQGAITNNGIRGGVRTVASLFVKHGLGQAGLALEGAAEEGITQILQNTVRQLAIDSDQDIFGGVMDAALQGAVMPILAAGPMAAIHHGRGPGGVDPVPIPPSPAAGDQTLADKFAGVRFAQVEEAANSESRLPNRLKRSLPAEADIPSLTEDVDFKRSDLVDKWIGDRQLAETVASLDARNHQKELKGLLREGEKAEQVDAAIAVYIDMKDNSDSYTAENILQLTPAQQTLVERAQSLSPAQQALAEQIIAENRALGIEAMEAEIIQSYSENYSARFWQKGGKPGKAKFTISTTRARQRTLPSLVEGWAKGLELAIPGAIEAQMVAKQQIAQVIHDRNFVSLGLKSEVFNTTRTDEHTTRVKHPNFSKWVWSGEVEAGIVVDPLTGESREARLKILGPDMFRDPETGRLFRRADIYASKDAAKFLNNALGSSELFNVKGVGEILKYNQILKHMILTTSGFHYAAFLRSFMLASRGVNPFKAYTEGRRLLEGKDPYTMELIHGGMTVGQALDFDLAIQQEGTKIGAIIDKVPMASGVRKALRFLSKTNTRFLFNKFGPYLKVQAASLELKYQLKKHTQALRDGKITRRQIVQDVANLMNDDFGGLNLQRMGRNPTMQSIHRIISLAPDWTESNVRSMVKAFNQGHEGQVYRGLWGRVLMKGLGATIISNLLMAGIDEDRDFIDLYKDAWESGNLRWLDVDITPLMRRFGNQTPGRKYFSILGHLRDPIKFAIYPGRSAKNKSSVLGRMAVEALTGTDWRGREFTSFGELLRNGEASKPVPFGGGVLNWEQFPSFIVKQAEQSTPIQVQAAIQRMRGEIDTFDMITRGVGVPTSTVKPPKRKKRKRRARQRRKQ